MHRPEFDREYDLGSLILVHPPNRNFSMYVTPRYREHYQDLPFEQHSADLVLALLSRIRLFIDVGAHYGFYALLAGRRDSQVEVIACEPTPETCKVLAQNVALNGLKNVAVHQIALSDQDGQARFNISISSDSCGFHVNPVAMPLRQVEVTTRRLESLLRDHAPCPTLVKIDTEGHEIAVLRGLGSVLRRFPDLQFLVEFNPLMQQAAGYAEDALLSCLWEMGFRVALVDEKARSSTWIYSQTQLSELVRPAGYGNVYCSRAGLPGRKSRSFQRFIDSPLDWKVRARELTIQGWCFGEHGLVVKAVRARRAGNVWPAHYGLARRDVAKAYPANPMAAQSGFEVKVTVPVLPGRLVLEAQDQTGRWHIIFSRWVSYWRRLLKLRPLLASRKTRRQQVAQAQPRGSARKLRRFERFIDSPLVWKVRARELTIQGWCFGEQGLVVKAVRARRARHVWHARYGLVRHDVAAAYPANLMAAQSGFEVKVTVPVLPGRVVLEAQDQAGRWHVIFSRWVSYWRRLLKPPPLPASRKTQRQQVAEAQPRVLESLRFSSCVLAVCHSDYRIAVAGTQKLLQQEEALLADKHISYLEIHPAPEQPMGTTRLGDFLAGFYVDAKYIGAFTIEQLSQLLKGMARAGARIDAVHLHHFLGYNLDLMQGLLNRIPARKTFFIHDFYSVCPQWNLVRADGKFCGAPPLGSRACQDCTHGAKRPAHFAAFRRLFDKCQPEFVVPSEFARDLWARAHPDLASKVRVVPHLVQKNGAVVRPSRRAGDRLRIAFVGYEHPIKGWAEWKHLAGRLRRADYEVFVLGNCAELPADVFYVPVSFVEQGPDAMTQALRDHAIDLAFLWSLVPETYSFTLFESMAAGCFVLTNPKSGNIALQVSRTGRGLVARDLDELTAFLQDRQMVEARLEQFRKEHPPFDLAPNPTLPEELAARLPNRPRFHNPFRLGSPPLAQAAATVGPAVKGSGGMAFFTSISSNYLPKALILANSVRRHRPEAPFYVVLCDKPPAELPRFGWAFSKVFLLEDLRLPVEDVEQWVFKHTVVELCTAVKAPFMVQAMEELQIDKLVYLDPDIVVLDKLQELETLLETHSVVVTPHLEEPESSLAAILDNEICALKHGVFNLGFLALRNTAEGRRFARWWCERSIHFCYDDIPNGLFTDQRWIDLAPGFFPDFYVLRDKSYNIATWNLSHRRVEKRADGRLCVAGAPIQFFHFSGFDSGAQLAMLNKYGAHSPALFELRDWYIAELDRAGQNEFGNLPWSFDCFSNGKVIRPEYRKLYREREDLRQAFPRPARVEEGKSYYHWCAENFRNGQPHRQKPPLLKKWKRSIMKRIPLVQSAIRKNGS